MQYYIREIPKSYNNHEGPTSTLKKKLTIPGPLYATNPNNVTVPIISKSLKITSNTCIKFDPTKMGTPPKIDMTMEKNCYLKMDSVIFHWHVRFLGVILKKDPWIVFLPISPGHPS